MNLGARLVTAAGAGELKAEPRALNLKGIEGPVIAHVVRVELYPPRYDEFRATYRTRIAQAFPF
jgi:hypothetical protein